MRRQYADDAARNLRAIWLGPTDGIRWFFDATYMQWFIAALSTLVLAVLFTFAIPLGAFILAIAWAGGSACALAYTERPRLARWGVFGMFTALALLISPNLLIWLSPMPLIISFIPALIVSVFGTWKFGRYVNGDRPIMYWASLPGRIANSPRPITSRPIDVSPLALAAHAAFKRRKIKTGSNPHVSQTDD